MNRKIAAGLLGLLYILGISAGIAVLVTKKGAADTKKTANLVAFSNIAKKNNIIGVINIDGPIYTSSGRNASPFTPPTGSVFWLSQLAYAETNSHIKAVLLRINSPGGTVGASQELHNAVQRVREAGKPVIVSVADMAASGGYYMAVAAERIFINPGSLTGSIGVIMNGFDATGLLQKIGIKYNAITSGTNKDTGTPYKEMSPEQRELLKSIIMNSYEQFLNAVASGRNRPIEEMRSLADGRIFTGEQAVRLGLADELGDMVKAENYIRQTYSLSSASLEEINPASSFNFHSLISGFLPAAPKLELKLPYNEFNHMPVLYMFQP
ncbi:signal peptide peptidase A. Serine peptidase. MEROPS family S49 [Brevinema andersonii]|uniref:Signal peptide peptidase A. Serine peptidase. MEROPS family S49 n=1 Tax=Brevinema andersonii TaxID=34097 RepID=A0A1I1DGN4_BREAD|nr:signal peptide peptidase SppA [Brevinema andersonii]SFB74007.1 signal peptide peptidase A. Serine peptidase. MEROPS family S49 [Brevinema andersonii]